MSEIDVLALISAMGSVMSFVDEAVLLEVDTSLTLAHGAYAWTRMVKLKAVMLLVSSLR